MLETDPAGFRSVKETVSRAGRKRRLSWDFHDTEQDSGLLKRQCHEQGGNRDCHGLCSTRTWIQVCKRDSITSREKTETVLDFARHGPGFRSVKETESRAGRKQRLCWALLDTDLDSGLLKRQYHEQGENGDCAGLCSRRTLQDSGLLKRQYHEQGENGDCAGLCSTRTWIQVC